MAHWSIVLVLFVSLCNSPALTAQAHEDGSTAREAVLSLAGKTLDAIRHKDANFLAALADPTGITVGFDVDKMSAREFRKELAAKEGVYCVILDASCTKGVQTSSTGTSLRQDLIAQPVTMTTAMQNAQLVSVTVRKAANPNEDLFTLWFRHVGNHWRLQHIEYF